VVLKQSQQAGFLKSWILDSSGSIPDSMRWIPDSKVVDSGFHRLKFPGFRIPDYLTWGDYLSPLKSGLVALSAEISHVMEFSQYRYNSTVAFRSTSRSDVTIRPIVSTRIQFSQEF